MKKLAFHNVEFSHNEQLKIVEYAEQRQYQLADVIQTSIEAGVKVSFSFSDHHDTAQLSLTPKPLEHPFYGYVVIIRHVSIGTLGSVLLWLVAEGFDQLDTPGKVNGRYDW